MTAPAPTPPSQRIEILDILRGFALFGVLMMNMQYFVSPSYPVVLHGEQAHFADWLGFWLVRLVADSKFYPLFSFLFGYGMAIQMRNAAARQTPFVGLYAARLTILLLIGACHSIVLWSGDILATYAVLGFVLLAFRNGSDAVLLTGGWIFLFGASAALAVLLGSIDVGALPAGWGETARTRFAGFGEGERRGFHQALSAMSMFFFGFYAGRKKLFPDGVRDEPRVDRVAAWGLGAGLVGNLAYVVLREHVAEYTLSWGWILTLATLAASGPLLAAGYVAALLRAARSERGRAWLAPLAPVGRMALTNYLLQTVICQALMGRQGLGSFGPVHPPLGVGMTVAVFAAQVWASGWWLRRFAFGPVEWLWRSLSYGRFQPLRR